MCNTLVTVDVWRLPSTCAFLIVTLILMRYAFIVLVRIFLLCVSEML